jgi:hypothetical protein
VTAASASCRVVEGPWQGDALSRRRYDRDVVGRLQLISREASALAGVVVGCVMIVGCGGAATSSAATADHVNQAKATAAADGMLRETEPLHSTTVAMSDLSNGGREAVARPFGWLQVTSVDRHELWQTSASPVTAVDLAAKGLPPGTKLLQRGSSGNEVLADYQLPASGQRSLGTRELSITAITDVTGTALRVDAEVAYFAPRLPSQRIPSNARVLDVTVGTNLKRPSLSLHLTSISEIRRIAGVINMLPFDDYEKGAVYNCPGVFTTTPVDRLVFRSSDTGTALATVTVPATAPATADPCAATTLVIGGHHEPDLQDGGRLLKAAGALLNVRLSR